MGLIQHYEALEDAKKAVERVGHFQVLAVAENREQLRQVTIGHDTIDDAIARGRCCIRHNLLQLQKVVHLWRWQLEVSPHAIGPMPFPAGARVLTSVVRRSALHLTNNLPDLLRTRRLLKAQGHIFTGVRVGPGDNGVPLPLKDLLLKDFCDQQVLAGLLLRDHP